MTLVSGNLERDVIITFGFSGTPTSKHDTNICFLLIPSVTYVFESQYASE